VPADDRSEGVVALSRWRAVLARSRNPRKRVDMLMADPQAAAIVPRIPVEELYYLVRGIGLEDATEVVRLALPEQIQGCLDLDLWSRDRLAMPRVLAWMDALAELSSSGLARAIRALDEELIALVITREARVYDRGVGEAPDDDSRFVVYQTPDAAFHVEFRTTTATAARTIERFIARLYDADPDLARAILIDAKWGTTAELEEESLRWRTARLADMGFPSYDEALGVYRRIDLAHLASTVAQPEDAVPSEPAALPVPFADAFGDDSLLERALAEIDDPGTLARVAAALVALLNRVLVADRVDPSDVDEVREVTARARDTLSLGLDRLTGADVGAARVHLERTPLVDVFRSGVSLVADLAARARALDRAGVIDPSLDALLEPRPLFPRALDPEPTAGERPFRTTADLAAVDAYLRDLERDSPAD
jgi:hypothetical protein